MEDKSAVHNAYGVYSFISFLEFVYIVSWRYAMYKNKHTGVLDFS